MKEPAELWFLAAVAWSRAYLADDATRKERRLADAAHRAMLRAAEADPERAKRYAKHARRPDAGPLFDEIEP